MEIHKNGLLIQEKKLKEKCALCKTYLYQQVYHYKGGLRTVVSCKECNKYTAMEKPKKYMTEIKETRKPSFLRKN
ncbi:MAG: hypothetical protein JW776_15140 [Candidatus Lokiarchaeota archaeon]|nr:hypothetical protein [Candidatus Lokiarchaeota archaeon]